MFLNALMVLYISVTGGQDVRGRALVVSLVRIRALHNSLPLDQRFLFLLAGERA